VDDMPRIGVTDRRQILLVRLRVLVELQFTVEVVDFTPQLRPMDSELSEYAMLPSCWRESTIVAAVYHLLLCL
jgi:hypothetical protein